MAAFNLDRGRGARAGDNEDAVREQGVRVADAVRSRHIALGRCTATRSERRSGDAFRCRLGRTLRRGASRWRRIPAIEDDASRANRAARAEMNAHPRGWELLAQLKPYGGARSRSGGC